MDTFVIRNGTVIDGTGAPRRRADVSLSDGRVVAVAEGQRASTEIDVSGLIVAPGFIDTHSHSDLKVLADGGLTMKIRQGITTEVFGQDGISVAPVKEEHRGEWKQRLAGLLGDFSVTWDWSSVADYLRRVAAAEPAPDAAYLAPHGALRQWVLGSGNVPAGARDLIAMQDLLRRALDDGACGMSTGLIYPPCCYADTAELIALGRVLAAARRPLVVHMRSESDRLLGAVDEMLSVARESGCAVHISHLKIAGRDNWPRLDALVEKLEGAVRDGLQITADQYPYVAGSTLLGAILPPWVHDGGVDKALLRLADPVARKEMRAQMEDPAPAPWDNFWKWGGPEGILIADVPSGRHPEMMGRRLSEIAETQHHDPFDTAFDLLLDERLGVSMVSFSQDEAVVQRLLTLPFVNVCTDGLLGGRPHPRAYGTYPRILGRYVRETHTLTLEDAVRKMTGQAALAFGFTEFGRLAPGQRGNVVVFDADTVMDRATFEDPAQYSTGIVHVIVGGELVVRDGEPTGRRPGKVVQ